MAHIARGIEREVGMASLNRVFLIGNLTKDPTLRYTPGGAAVADLRLAVTSTFSSKSGEKKEEVCYVDVVTWGRQAETASEYLKKGSPIFVEGRLQFDTWETAEGEKRSRHRVRAAIVQFLSRGEGKGGGKPPRGEDVDGPTQEPERPDGPPDEVPGAGGGGDGDVPF
jgi:single-strand DNA-binding protein